MTATIVGAGSVGLTLAARLRASGQAVRLITRRTEAATRLREEGLHAEHAATGERKSWEVEAATWSEAPDSNGEPIFLCTRGDAVESACGDIHQWAPSSPVVTFQNDVVCEEIAARTVERVIGGVWRETCTQISDHEVRFLTDRPGRAILGRYPSGTHKEVEVLAARLERAGLRTGVSTQISEDKWLKLCVNLMSAPNALVVREDHDDASFVEVKVRLLQEARDVLSAAQIRSSSCDGKDRSLDEEIEYQRNALATGNSARPIPLYNQVWRALRKGSSLEADAYHQRILDLGAQHGVEAPANRRTLEVLLRAARDELGPESVRASELLP